MRTIRLVLTVFLAVFCPVAGYSSDIFEKNASLGNGVNFGNALEAPVEGWWGMVLEAEFFELVSHAGFDHVRLPVRFSAHAAEQAPYTIDEEFFQRVDWAIDQALANDLVIIIDKHHYDEIFEQPDAHADRFVAIWEQISRRYKDKPETVYFELLNEPHNQLDAPRWNRLVERTLEVIRQDNPDRAVVVGSVHWNTYDRLHELRLPDDDRNIIVTFHYYEPFHFTHQGADWVDADSDAWLGTTWQGSEPEKAEIIENFDVVLEWAREHNRPIYLGEFGVFQTADMDSRVRWTSFVAAQADKRGFSRAYWEFGAGFGIYDRSQNQWRQRLKEALF